MARRDSVHQVRAESGLVDIAIKEGMTNCHGIHRHLGAGKLAFFIYDVHA